MQIKKEKKMRMRLKTVGLIVLFLAGILTGCSEYLDEENDMNRTEKGTVAIKITDAPFPADLVAEANVTIDQITLIKNFMDPGEEPEGENDDSGESNPGENDDPEEEDEGENNEEETESTFINIVMDEPVTYNLLELSNGTTALLAEMEIPTGTYSEIRLHVTEAGIVLKEGDTFDLKIPGGDASGQKIKMNPALEMEDGAFVEVLLDFDVSRSFVMRGNMKHGMGKVNGFIFKPVIRAMAQVQTTTGEVSGYVTNEAGDPVENALLSLVSGEDTITSALTKNTGFYAMIGIPPGSYLLACEMEEYEVETVQVEVEKRKVTEQNIELKKSDKGNGEEDE